MKLPAANRLSAARPNLPGAAGRRFVRLLCSTAMTAITTASRPREAGSATIIVNAARAQKPQSGLDRAGRVISAPPPQKIHSA